MVHIPRSEVAEAGFLVAFFAGESEPFAVAKRMLVDIRLAVGQVLDVLYCHSAEVGNPTGTAEGELKLSAKPNMVYFIEAADNYIMVYYLNAGKLEKLMIRNSLKNIEWRFRDKGLVRCHRSFIVNIRLVKLFRRQEGEVMLDFGDEKIPSIPVSKGYGEGVMSMLL